MESKFKIEKFKSNPLVPSMKIIVPVKRVPDYESKIKILSDGSGIVTEGIKWIANPFDEIAVEEALRLKEQGHATEVVAVTIGPADAVTQLRYALAMGADRGIHVVVSEAIDSHVAAQVLRALVVKEAPHLVLMGKQAIDSDANQTAQLVAGGLGWPQACFASKIVVQAGADGGTELHVTREIDGGLETLAVPLPAVVSTDLRLNEPRYASLPNIMKAKKKQVDELKCVDLGVTAAPRVVVRSLSFPPRRAAGKKVGSVAELVAALRDDAKVF